MFMQKLRKDKRGLSLVELVCAIAILAIISMTVGGAMVFASNSYRQGTIDTALQQEAQFTANAIESLIIDATKTVDFAGGVLTITNTDYVYIIKYDAVEQTLRYTQHVYGDPDNKVADNELLAEHVVSFHVDASNFATSRNVILEIGLENGNSVFTTNYNVTSRNDASAGDAPDVFAQIICDNLLVLEPNQYYNMSVQIMGSADTGYGVSLEGQESMDTEAVKTPTGVRITLGATENGGDDAQFHVRITTSATDGEGNPFEKIVTVKVRRTTGVSFSSLELVSGDAFKAGAKYRVTATPTGTNLEEVAGATYDIAPYAYVHPYNVSWSFSMSDGSAVSDWMQVGATGTEDNTVEVILKQDLPVGTAIKLKATALHSRGTLRNAAYNNKASVQQIGEIFYDNVFDEVELVKTTGDSKFMRGEDFNIDIDRKIEQIIEEEWNRNHPGEPFPDYLKPNGVYTGNHHIRYKATAAYFEDESDQSAGYPNWKKLSFQGQNLKEIEFKADDLADMKYMKGYKLDLVYSFIYQDQNNNFHVYPEGFTAESGDDVDPVDIYSWDIEPVGIVFGKCQVDGGTPIDLSEEGYLYEAGKAVGSHTNPLVVNRSHSTCITYTAIGPATNKKSGIRNFLDQPARVYEWNGSSYVFKRTTHIQHQANDDKKSGTLTFGTVNDFNNIEKNPEGRYMLLLGRTRTENDEVIAEGQIFTDETGWETYSIKNTSGAASRGQIYIKIN